MNEMNQNNVTATGTTSRTYRPKLAFYHANAKGTGGAAELDLHPAHDDTDGSIMMKIANQMTVGNRQGPNPTYPRFDWENAISVKLGFDDLCQMLQVFRGECEEIGEGRGLYHSSAKATTVIKLRHFVDPQSAYSLEVYRKLRANGEESNARILLSPAEALGLCESIAGSMSVICFGIPVVLPHDTSKYEADQRSFRHAAA